jgi:hypothetical protein
LQRAQHLGLRREIHVADLVEEQRAAVGLLEEAALSPLRASERAALVTEQLALDQLTRDGRAVHFDERRVFARAQPVNGAADQLLASAGFTGDEHTGLGGRDLVDISEKLLNWLAGADHLVARLELGAHALDGARQARRANGVLHADQHALARQRLFEEVAGPELDGQDGVVHGGVAAHHHHRNVLGRLVGAQLFQRLQARHARQLEVEDRDIDRLLGVG